MSDTVTLPGGSQTQSYILVSAGTPVQIAGGVLNSTVNAGIAQSLVQAASSGLGVAGNESVGMYNLGNSGYTGLDAAQAYKYASTILNINPTSSAATVGVQYSNTNLIIDQSTGAKNSGSAVVPSSLADTIYGSYGGNDPAIENFVAGNNPFLYYTNDGSGTIVAGTGNDTIVSSGGHDIFLGGGTDSIVSTGNDTINLQFGTDAISVGGGTDFVYVNNDGSDTVNLSGVGSAVVKEAGGTYQKLTVINRGGPATVYGGNGSDTVDGGLSGGYFTGGAAGGNSLLGGSGALSQTTLFGGGDGDTLIAAGGTTSIQAGFGSETVVAGGGSGATDLITAFGNQYGGGADTFLFVSGSAAGSVQISDFTVGQDTIALTGGYTSSDLASLQQQITSQQGSFVPGGSETLHLGSTTITFTDLSQALTTNDVKLV